MVIKNKNRAKRSPAYVRGKQQLSSMVNMEQPVGFFSTFSILDPNGTHEHSSRTQKRNRRVFVCIPCHRRKLKCDKGQPCSRCSQSGSADDCVYQPSPNSSKRKYQAKTPEPQSSPSLPSERPSDGLDQTRASHRTCDERTRTTGITHCAKIACEVSYLTLSVVHTGTAWLTSMFTVRGSSPFSVWTSTSVGD